MADLGPVAHPAERAQDEVPRRPLLLTSRRVVDHGRRTASACRPS